MRVVVAPDSFGGTLTAPEAADAIAAGWRRAAPGDDVRTVPLADGGTGFSDVLHAALGGTRHEVTVIGPLGSPVAGSWLEVDGTAYVEAATACGLHHVPRERRVPDVARAATSRGVGELMVAARDAGVRRIVVGLGGSATTDGGAGMLAALGVAACDAAGAPLPDGGAPLARCAALHPDAGAHPAAADGGAAGPTAGAIATADALVTAVGLGGVELVAAADVDNPLLGRHGAAAVFGPQKGADDGAVVELDAALAVFGEVLGAIRPGVADERAAGAAGGLGAALLTLGAVVEPGAGLVRTLTGLDAELDAAAAAGGLALTGEGSFDWQSLRGKLITAVAGGAAERGMPCVVLAGQVSVGRREMGAAGVAAAYAVADESGLEASLADPAGTLSALAEHVARRWSRSTG